MAKARKKPKAPKRLTYDVRAFRVDKRSKVLNADDFVNSGEWVLVRSSNVKRIQYLKKEKKLLVEFKRKGNSPGRIYTYFPANPRIAKNMYMASSMGIFVRRVLATSGLNFTFVFV